MKKAAIIADYGKDTGMGHLVRCGSLVKELKEDFSVVFAAVNDEHFPFVKEFAEKAGAGAVAVDELLYVGGYVKADLIIIDNPKTTAKLLTDIKNDYEVCAVIDDNHILPFYDVDFVINQNIGAENRTYHARKDTELLLGLEYLMLRDIFADAKPIDISADVKNIVVTMGGSDYKNTTQKALELLSGYGEYVIHVVVGPAFQNKRQLESFAKSAANVILHYDPLMPEVFSKCQAAVSACGSTVYELAAMGVPTVGIITAENQQSASIEMENGGLIVSAGLSEKLSDWYFRELFDDITKNVQLRRKMHETQTSLIRRDGAIRIKERLAARFMK